LVPAQTVRWLVGWNFLDLVDELPKHASLQRFGEMVCQHDFRWAVRFSVMSPDEILSLMKK
jgi:hypothetical protein